jgi:hypothetical protein
VASVSYSYPWIDALPGLEWSQSLPEMCEYAVRRVFPDSDLIALRAQAAAEEVWAAKGQWQRLSQRRRILRWVTSRPTRPATMYAVHAALGDSDVTASAA